MLFILYFVIGLTFQTIEDIIPQKIRLTQNEQYWIGDINVNLPLNKITEDELMEAAKKQNLTLIIEYDRFKFDKIKGEVYTIISDNSSFIDLCILDHAQFKCILRVSNSLNDGRILIFKENFQSIDFEVPKTQCSFINKINDQNYILGCQFNERTQLIIIDTRTSEILDLITLETTKIISVSQNSLLSYQTNCLICVLRIINIRNFKFDPQQQIQILKNQQKFPGETGLLLDVQICDQKHIRLQYERVFIYYETIDWNFLRYDDSNSVIDGNCPLNSLKTNFNKYAKQQQNQITQITDSVQYNENVQYVFDVNQNLILLIDNRITVINNQYLNQTVNETFLQISKLGNLPYLLALTEQSEIVIYKVNQYDTCFGYMNSNYVASIKRFNYQFHREGTKLFQVEFFDLLNPSVIVEKKIEYFVIEHTQEIMPLNINILSYGLPIEIQNIKDSNGIVDSLGQNQNQLCDLDEHILSLEFQFLTQNTHVIAVIYTNLSGEICIKACNKKKQQKLPFNFANGVEKIFVSQNQPNFAIVKKFAVILFSVTPNIEIQLGHIIEDDHPFKIIKEEDQLELQLSNCTLVTINLRQFSEIEFRDHNIFNSFKNCTLPEKITLPNLYIINGNAILQTQQNYIISQSFHNLLQFESVQRIFGAKRSLLLFELSPDNEILMKLYSVKNKITLIYEIPTYEYRILNPIHFTNTLSYLMVAGTKLNQEVLLIYDLKYQASGCLRAIIPIDRGNYNFDFIQNSIFYFIFNNSLVFRKLDQLIINFKYNQTTQNMRKSQIFINFTSLIPCQSKALDFEIIQKNLIFTLKFRNIRNEFLQVDQNNAILLNNIIGNILTINLIDNQVAIIQKPFITYDSSANCSQFKQQVCFFNGSISIDIFQKDLITLKEKVNQIQFVELEQDYYYIYYKNDELDLYLLRYPIKSDLEQAKSNAIMIPQELQQEEILFIRKNIKFFETDTSVIIWNSDSQKQLYSKQLKPKQQKRIIYLQNNTFMIFSTDSQLKITKLFVGQEQLIEESIQLDIGQVLERIEMLNFQLKDAILFVELFLDYRESYGQVNIIKINLKNLNLVEQNEKTYVRYGKQLWCEQVLFANGQYLILSTTNGQKAKYLSMYDISQRKNQEMLDSIYSQINNETIKIEKYNETHFVQIFKNDTVQLIMIDKYRIICENECLNQYQVILTNEVSSIQTLLIKKDKQQNSIIGIIIIDLLFIIGFLKYRKNKYQFIRKQ